MCFAAELGLLDVQFDTVLLIWLSSVGSGNIDSSLWWVGSLGRQVERGAFGRIFSLIAVIARRRCVAAVAAVAAVSVRCIVMSCPWQLQAPPSTTADRS